MNIMWSPVWATIHAYLRDFFLHVAIVSVERTATRAIWLNLIYLHADEAVTFRRFPSYGRSETLCALFVTTSTANRCWFHHYTYHYYFLISTKITFTLHFCNVWNCSPNHNAMANVPHFSSLVPNMNLRARTNNELFDKRQQNNIIHTKRPKIRRAAFFFSTLPLIFPSVSIVGLALAMRSIGISINSWSNVSLRYQNQTLYPTVPLVSPCFLSCFRSHSQICHFYVAVTAAVASSFATSIPLLDEMKKTISEKSKAWGNRSLVLRPCRLMVFVSASFKWYLIRFGWTMHDGKSTAGV